MDAPGSSQETPPSLRLDGSWERAGRNTNAAALLALLGIGAVYFNVQSLLAIAAVGIVKLTTTIPEMSGDFLQRILKTIRYFSDPLRIVVVLTQYLFMLLPALWLVRRWHTRDVRQYIRLKPGPVVDTILAVLITLMVIPGGNYIADQLVRQLGVPRELLEINAEIFTARSPLEFLWLVFVVCLTPALSEEIFFRGYVQRTFERTMGWKSVILIGVLFGLFHFQPLGLITLSILGMLFGYFFYRSKSLLPSMAAHFANNLTAVILLYRDPSQPDITNASAEIPLSLVGLTLPAGIGLMVVYHWKTRERGKT